MNLLPSRPQSPSDRIVDEPDGRYLRIDASHLLPTFFMTLVSATDRWLFVASNGGVSAGRVNAAQALFPFQTVDRIIDSATASGPMTAIWCKGGDGEVLWEPFRDVPPRQADCTRALLKSVEGDRIWFEETHHGLGLTFRYGWAVSAGDGFVRRVELLNHSGAVRQVRLLDGVRNLLPPGISRTLQNEYSCLADAYKTAERPDRSTLAIYALAAGIIDRAVAVESLQASVAWSAGLEADAVLLSEAQVAAFLAGGAVQDERSSRGVRGAYLLEKVLELAPGAREAWLMVLEYGLSQAEVVALQQRVGRPGAAAEVEAALLAGTRELRTLVGAADGQQCTGDEVAVVHHFANVTFNIMRGGVFVDNGRIGTGDLARFIRVRNRPVAKRHAEWLAGLPASLTSADLLARAEATADPDLLRLALEYLPLTFSRRHGDPSRPWNRFNIVTRDAAGELVLNYEGNWRDIFQNWESLCLSYPEYLPHVIAKFLSASTADGYNPYRLTRGGIEWEVPEPGNPWAGIGYWGDHQAIYLLRLLEWSERFFPGRLGGWLDQPLLAYANVPYRIADYAALRANPRQTIHFDRELHQQIEARVAEMGTDARLLVDGEGRVVHATLAEKLLLLVLTRMANFVPGGGIWMNTQRPEWNDANNALVGYGVSVVTLAQLRRFVEFWDTRLLAAAEGRTVAIAGGLTAFAAAVGEALAEHVAMLEQPSIDPQERRQLVDRLGEAGSRYREGLYAGGLQPPQAVEVASLRALAQQMLAHIDHSLRLAQAPGGLFDSYNLLAFGENPARLEVSRLQPMLEGQVAVLGAGVLSPGEAADLLDALRASPLFRPDQNSYLLYPDRDLPGFLVRNCIPEAAVNANPLLRDLLAQGDRRLVLRDAAGQVRFNPDLVQEQALQQRLDTLAAEPVWAERVRQHRAGVGEVYEQVFHHRAFTGRSGSMFGYEGLGCIYWHMVAKLLLAAQENEQAAHAAGDPATARLAAHYTEVRNGIGYRRDAASYGAFITDPYSHTPGHSGAQQPGMTGQVKEEILTRLGELGVTIADGRIALEPARVAASEYLATEGVFEWCDVHGKQQSCTLPAGSLGFTLCGVPVTYRRGGKGRRLKIRLDSGATVESTDLTLGEEHSRMVFSRTGAIVEINAEA